MWTKEQKASFCAEAYTPQAYSPVQCKQQKGTLCCTIQGYDNEVGQNNFEKEALFSNKAHGPAKSVRTQANFAALKQSLQQSPTRSTPHRAARSGARDKENIVHVPAEGVQSEGLQAVCASEAY